MNVESGSTVVSPPEAAAGCRGRAVRPRRAYVDVGTLDGYGEAIGLLATAHACQEHQEGSDGQS
jgi:hypothetical protein